MTSPELRFLANPLFFFTLVLLTSATTGFAAPPALSGTIPTQLVPGRSTELIVNGSGFISESQIIINGTPVATSYTSPTQLKATFVAQPAPGAATVVAVKSGTSGISAPVLLWTEPAAPKVSYGAAVRFLEQAAFGPDPRSIARVQELGFDGWLNEQIPMNKSSYPNSGDTSMNLTGVQARFFSNIVTGEDQLRQRVALALAEIFVISGYKTFSPQQVMPYLQLLQDHALGNYQTLLRAVTLSPTMGVYLDMANNVKANSYNGSVANENYAREVLQLFSIGTDILNADGSRQLASDGSPIPAYSQDTIAAFARVFTGWTFAPAPGKTSSTVNPRYFNAPMQASETLHDTTTKTLLNGVTLPAGQTAAQDLDGAMANIFSHANLGPMVAKRLIKALVTSNPSPAYVSRVAQVFNSSSAGRGDLAAVVKAVLLDAEARAGDPPNVAPADFGHLREPILYMAAALRGMGASVTNLNYLPWYGRTMDQAPLYPASVFGYYSPDYVIPGTTLTAPEFQIFSPSTAIARANFAQTASFNPAAIGVTMGSSQLEALRGDPEAITEYLSRVYLRGQMTAQMKEIIRPAILAFNSGLPLHRAQVAMYLTISSPFFEVQQ